MDGQVASLLKGHADILSGIMDAITRQRDRIFKLEDELKSTRAVVFVLLAQTSVNVRIAGGEIISDKETKLNEIEKQLTEYDDIYNSAISAVQSKTPPTQEKQKEREQKPVKFPKLPMGVLEDINQLEKNVNDTKYKDPFTEESALDGCSKYKKREILRGLSDDVRWGRLERRVIDGVVWFFPTFISSSARASSRNSKLILG